MLLGEMAWPDFAANAPSGFAIVPVGAVEPHGPHLPLATDTLISEYFARRLAQTLDGGWVTPPIGYGVATPSVRLGGDFPGVINISGSTFTRLVVEVLSALARYGVRRYVIVNSAIDNLGFLCEAARLLREAAPAARVMVVNWWDVVGETFRDELAHQTGVDRRDDHHAGMVESSLIMHIAPHTVQGDAEDAAAGPDPAVRRMRYHVFPLPVDAATTSGIVYTAAKASADIGARVAERVVHTMTAAVRRELLDHPAGQ